MLIPVPFVLRSVDDVDLSDLTDAVRTGPAVWTDGGLEVPFDRDLTPDEVTAVARRLMSTDATEEQQWNDVTTFLDNPTPDLAAITAQVRILTDLALRLLNQPR